MAGDFEQKMEDEVQKDVSDPLKFFRFSGSKMRPKTRKTTITKFIILNLKFPMKLDTILDTGINENNDKKQAKVGSKELINIPGLRNRTYWCSKTWLFNGKAMILIYGLVHFIIYLNEQMSLKKVQKTS